MRLAALFVLALPCMGQFGGMFPGPGTVHTTGGGGGIAVVGTPTGTYSGGFGNNPVSAPATSHTAGNMLLVFATAGSCPTFTVSNTAGDTWTAVGACFTNGSSAASIQAFTTITAGNASDVVQVSSNSPFLTALYTVEISGVTAVDQIATGSGTTATITSGNFTTTTANEIIVAALRLPAQDGTITGDTGYTLGTCDSGGCTSAFGGTQYKVVSSIQTGANTTFAWSSGAFRNAGIYVVTLK